MVFNMTASNTKWTVLWAALSLVPCASALAAPIDPPADETDDSATDEPEVTDYKESDKKADYKPKTDAEGSTWTFDPQKVELTTGKSDTGTNFQGARILKGGEDVVVQGQTGEGKYTGTNAERYQYWQGSTLYFGVQSPDTKNSVDAIAEFFWFESSIPRGSDFYVMQIKVKSSPNPWDKWILAKEPNFLDDYILFWNDIQPAQHLDVTMEPGGAHGALRWDFCVPFETYKWEPVKTMQIAESYGAGYSVNAAANLEGKASKQFQEGGAVADLSGNVDIQSKGYVNNDFKVQSQYTITLYKWQMLVQSGGEDIHYKLVVLPHDKQKDNQSDSGYYEYFIVIQATRGTPVHISEIEIGGMFRHDVPLWFDGYEGISATAGDIWVTPPRGVCLPGDIAPPDTCKKKGVCGLAEPKCVGNQWQCPIMNVYEDALETKCDGLDNDCDGKTDEDLVRECATSCGKGYESCTGGKWLGCDAPKPVAEVCGDGVDNDCDGKIDSNCGTTNPPPKTDPPPAEEPKKDPPPVVPPPTAPSDEPADGATDEPSQQPKTALPPAQGGSSCSAGATGSAPIWAGFALLLAFVAVRRGRKAP